jgi:hypothetical protein
MPKTRQTKFALSTSVAAEIVNMMASDLSMSGGRFRIVPRENSATSDVLFDWTNSADSVAVLAWLNGWMSRKLWESCR